MSLSRIRPDPRIRLSQAQLSSSEFTWTGGIRCATVQRALFDEMRWAPGVRAAVIAMEKAAAAKLISVRLMSEYVVERSGWTGVGQVREALGLSRDSSRSPPESALRMVWELDAGLPPPHCNVPVFSLAGRLLGYPDLFDERAGLVGEYEGEDHKNGQRHRQDVAREQQFREHGLEYFPVVGGDLRDRGLVVRRILSTRARAAFAPPEQRRWTLTPPPWWTPEESLDLHLARIGVAPMLVRC